ncbi:MAG: hypothetical protein ACJ72N_21955 [Labedaea sp.]
MTGWESIDAALRALGIRIGAPTPGQTTSGGHVAGSEHFQGRARDYGTSDSDADAIARALVPFAQGPDAPVDELFYSPLGIFYDSGKAYSPTPTERANHYSHVHVGIRPGVDLAAAVAGGAASSSSSGTATLISSIPGAGLVGDLFAPIRKTALTVVFVGAGVGLVALGGLRFVKAHPAALERATGVGGLT